MTSFIKFIVNLDPGRRLFIQTHDFPDPDAIASAYGLRQIIRAYGIRAELCFKGLMESSDVDYILASYKIPWREASGLADLGPDDKIILVDCQKFNSNVTDLPGDEIACIDHHPLNRKGCCEANYQYIDLRPTGSCSSIIAEYYSKLGVTMSREAATLLLYGLKIDTAYFQRGVTQLDIDAFALLERRADQEMLKRLAGRTLKVKDMLAFGAAINGMHIRDGLGIVKIPFACPDHLLGQLADFVLSLAEVDTAIVYSVREEGMKFSARSLLPHIHCGNMLKQVLGQAGGSGGGHRQMAGGFVGGTLPDQRLEKDFYDYVLAHERYRHEPDTE